MVHGSADGAATSVNWFSLLPAARIRWLFADRGRFALVGGYARSANALNLNWLAYGDPAAHVARIAADARPAVIVARVGPGTGGDPLFSQIDDDLRRPYTDEFVVGLDAGRMESMRFTLTGLARREGNILAVVNTGVPLSGYSTVEIPDEYIFLRNPEDDRMLTVYNRLPSTFGQDTYVVTNPELDAAHSLALRLTAERASERLFILFGATAYLAEGSGGSRGYGPRENDQDVPGELFTNPNAATYARGRLFSDRGFTIKWTTLYRMPYDITVGAIARYQDGQPFSRMVVVRDLNQGTEAVQAYPNGGTRFTFTGTLDLRLQKGFTIGSTRLDAVFDAYNLLTRSNEVEEYVVTGPDFRTSTAIQPPHSLHLGLRVTSKRNSLGFPSCPWCPLWCLCCSGGRGWALFKLRTVVDVACGYKSKVLCTAIFASGRPLDPAARGRDRSGQLLAVATIRCHGRPPRRLGDDVARGLAPPHGHLSIGLGSDPRCWSPGRSVKPGSRRSSPRLTCRPICFRTSSRSPAHRRSRIRGAESCATEADARCYRRARRPDRRRAVRARRRSRYSPAWLVDGQERAERAHRHPRRRRPAVDRLA